MSIIERGFQFLDSLFGATVDTVMGRGGDGIPGSSVEDYVRTEDSQKTDIHINADSIDLKADAVKIEQVAESAVIEPTPDINTHHDWSALEKTPEPAAPQMEDYQDDGLTLGR